MIKCRKLPNGFTKTSTVRTGLHHLGHFRLRHADGMRRRVPDLLTSASRSPALSIPARYFAGYAFQLNPPDFHACFEAYHRRTLNSLQMPRILPLEWAGAHWSGRDAAERVGLHRFWHREIGEAGHSLECPDRDFQPLGGDELKQERIFAGGEAGMSRRRIIHTTTYRYTVLRSFLIAPFGGATAGGARFAGAGFASAELSRPAASHGIVTSLEIPPPPLRSRGIFRAGRAAGVQK